MTNTERLFEYRGVKVLILSWCTAEWHYCLNGVLFLSYASWEGEAEKHARAAIDKAWLERKA